MQSSNLFNDENFQKELATIDQRLSQLENILLSSELSRQGRPEQPFNQNGFDVLSVTHTIWQSLEQASILSAAVTGLRQLFQADRVCVFYLLAKTKQTQGICVAEDTLPGILPLLNLTLCLTEPNAQLCPEILEGKVVAVDASLSSFDALLPDEIRNSIKGSLIAPLFRKKQLWGVLLVHQCATSRIWQANEVELLSYIVTHAETALEQAERLAEAERRSAVLQSSLVTELSKRADESTLKAKQEATFNRVVKKIRQTMDVKTIFETTVQESRSLLRCDRSSIYRFNPDWSGEYICESVAEGWRSLVVGDKVRTTWADTYLQETKGGRYQRQEAFAVDDIYAAGLHACHVEVLEQFQVRSYCIASVFVGDRLWGLLAAYHNSGPRHWESDEINLLNRIADQLGVALQHAQSMEQLQLQSEQLAKAVEREKAVAAIIDKIRRSLDINVLFQTTVHEVRQLAQADRVTIYRFNPDWSGEFVVESVVEGWKSLLQNQSEQTGLNRNGSEPWARSSVVPEAVDTYFQETQGGPYAHGEACRVSNDIYQSGFSDCYIDFLESLQARAYANVAIYKGEKLWGLLAVYQNSAPRFWERADINFLIQVSSHLGVALQQAELLGQAEQRSTVLQTTLEMQLRQRAEELSREAERERAIFQVIDKIRRTLDIETIFQTTAIEVRRLLNADRVAMFQFFPGSSCHEGEFVSEDVLPSFPSAMAARVHDHCFGERHATHYQQGRIWATDDIYQANLPHCHQAILARFQVRANLVVPLLQGEHLWGLLCIHQCSAPRKWQEKEKEFVNQIAAQLSVALQQVKFLNQVQKAKEAADAANKAKSEFLANMSHELRTPLNVILGFVQLMTKDDTLPIEHKEHLEVVGLSGEHLLTLINDVLEMSKIEAGQLYLNETSFDLYRLLQSLQEMLDLKAELKGLQLLFDRTPDVPQYIFADESKLRQVLINLLSNGIKFTEQGHVLLRVYRGELPNDMTVPALLFEVIDTGAGIAAQDLDHLFEAFGQTETGRKTQDGTGLGLPISRRFVRLMGSDIWVESTPGVGSTFKFAIPLQLAEASDVQTLKPQRRVIGLESGQPDYRILIVEDKWANRQLLVKLLTSVGFEVKEAKNGVEALLIYEEWQPHLIWMDMRMPEMDGYEATHRIRTSQCPCSPKILALTANAFEEERLVALAIGCDDFIRKPCQEEIILEKMAEHLGVRYLYDEPAKSSTPDRSRHSSPISTTMTLDQSPPTPQPLNILVAEDNPLNQKLMMQMLQRLGYQADMVSNGLDVLNRLRQQPYDIVLLDVNMPEMDGITTVQRIRQEWKSECRPTLIAVSGKTLPEEQQQLLAAGMDAYLAKPFRLEGLAAILQQYQNKTRQQVTCDSSQESLLPARLDQEALKELQEVAGENATFLVSLIETYKEEAPKLLKDIKNAILAQQADQLGWAAHSFKTMSAHLGAMEFSQLCQELENMGTAGQVIVPTELLDRLELEYKRVELALMLEQAQAQSRATAYLDGQQA